MDSRRERFNPTDPLPQRDPMKTLADWGAPPEPGAYERPWDGGPPPWAARERSRRALPGWAVLSLMMGLSYLAVVVIAGLLLWLSS